MQLDLRVISSHTHGIHGSFTSISQLQIVEAINYLCKAYLWPDSRVNVAHVLYKNIIRDGCLLIGKKDNSAYCITLYKNW